jgi:hypothetical protein
MAVAQERVEAETSRTRAEVADESAGSDFGELLRDWNDDSASNGDD